MSRLSTKQRRARVKRRRHQRVLVVRDRLNALGSRSKHYDEFGREIGFGDWAYLMEWGGFRRRRVASTYLPDQTWVSTVALGIDQGIGNDRPVLFETMVFDKKGNDLDSMRWCTRGEAERGHRSMVEEWRKP
jgi:hypothetical protein